MNRVKSSVDRGVRILIGGTLFLLFLSPVVVPEGKLVTLLAVLPIAAFLLWIRFGTWYELREDELYCVSGPFRERIRYDRIRSLRLTSNRLSSMALSARRIEIRQHGKGYLTGTTLISPENREAFLAELAGRCHHLDENL